MLTSWLSQRLIEYIDRGCLAGRFNEQIQHDIQIINNHYHHKLCEVDLPQYSMECHERSMLSHFSLNMLRTGRMPSECCAIVNNAQWNLVWQLSNLLCTNRVKKKSSSTFILSSTSRYKVSSCTKFIQSYNTFWTHSKETST